MPRNVHLLGHQIFIESLLCECLLLDIEAMEEIAVNETDKIFIHMEDGDNKQKMNRSHQRAICDKCCRKQESGGGRGVPRVRAAWGQGSPIKGGR